MEKIDFFTSERKIEKKYYFNSNVKKADKNTLRQFRVVSNGDVRQNKFIQAKADKQQNFHSLTIRFRETVEVSGLSIRFRLRNWSNIQYLAIGSNVDGEFRHVKITNPKVGTWQVISFSYEDLSYQIQNGFVGNRSLSINDISVKLKANMPTNESFMEILEVAFWTEEEKSQTNWMQIDDHQRLRWKLIDRIHDYQTSSIKHYSKSCERFFADGTCPIVKNLYWPNQDKKPPELNEVNTYRYSWHALHHVASLILYSKLNGRGEAVDFAKKFANNWMNDSWLVPDEDIRFAWYDHGTAERQLSMVMLYHELSNSEEIDEIYLQKLKKIILLQGRLLESEIFYARNQINRYHNHAMFQDVALIVTALSFTKVSCTKRWLKTGVSRLEDQISKLIIRDDRYSVFVENSIGYHSGIIRLLQFSSDLISLFDEKSGIHAVYSGMQKFSKLLKYPDGRSPAQGDTQRLPNEIGKKKTLRSQQSGGTILKNAGYGVVKGSDEESFMLVFFATGLSHTHKHQDNLSFTLFFDHLEWLIDPSHYSHEYEEQITKYLRSAEAHNMICLPYKEHSIEPGLANIDGVVSDTKYLIEGQNLAYSENIVSRKIQGNYTKLDIKISDYVDSKSLENVDARLMLHCGEHIDVEQSGSIVTLSCKNSTHKLCIDMPNDNVVINKGLVEKDRVRGISGLGFMSHSSINTIECLVPVNENIEWRIYKI